MAKRKRLTPPQPGYLDTPAPASGAMRAMRDPAPIAQVAGEASARAALAELGDVLHTARAEGRLIETLPLEAIDAGHLVRDRLVQADEDMEALMASLLARGQQAPVEVVALPAPRGGVTHGLISGWRRLTALQQLHRDHPDGRFARVKALVVAPADRQAAYVAMVEENEIRANLSLYERARIAMRAYQGQIYPTQKLALQGLFGAVSRSKRSKINSFIGVVAALDGALRFPTAISEKLGLDLARALTDVPGFRSKVLAALQRAAPRTADAEMKCLSGLLAGTVRRPPRAPRAPEPARGAMAVDGDESTSGRRGAVTVRFDAGVNRIELTGRGVTPALHAALQDWLKRR